MADLQGKDFVALRRLSDVDDRTISAVGETCERVPAAKSGGTVSDALARLLASRKITCVTHQPEEVTPLGQSDRTFVCRVCGTMTQAPAPEAPAVAPAALGDASVSEAAPAAAPDAAKTATRKGTPS